MFNWSVFLLCLITFSFVAQLSVNTFGFLGDLYLHDYTANESGIITRSQRVRLGSYRERAEFDIEYTYSVNGIEFRNTVVGNFHKTENIDEMLERFPVGKEVIVYYDPNAIRKSVLIEDSISFGMVVQLLVIVGLSLVISFTQWRKER